MLKMHVVLTYTLTIVISRYALMPALQACRLTNCSSKETEGEFVPKVPELEHDSISVLFQAESKYPLPPCLLLEISVHQRGF